MKVYAIHEASGQDITYLDDCAYNLVTGGGNPVKVIPAYSYCRILH